MVGLNCQTQVFDADAADKPGRSVLFYRVGREVDDVEISLAVLGDEDVSHGFLNGHFADVDATLFDELLQFDARH